MKTLIYTLIVVAICLIGYNATFLDFENLTSGDSKTALIGVLAASCVILLMVILLISKSISQKAGR